MTFLPRPQEILLLLFQFGIYNCFEKFDHLLDGFVRVRFCSFSALLKTNRESVPFFASQKMVPRTSTNRNAAGGKF